MFERLKQLVAPVRNWWRRRRTRAAREQRQLKRRLRVLEKAYLRSRARKMRLGKRVPAPPLELQRAFQAPEQPQPRDTAQEVPDAAPQVEREEEAPTAPEAASLPDAPPVTAPETSAAPPEDVTEAPAAPKEPVTAEPPTTTEVPPPAAQPYTPSPPPAPRVVSAERDETPAIEPTAPEPPADTPEPPPESTDKPSETPQREFPTPEEFHEAMGQPETVKPAPPPASPEKPVAESPERPSLDVQSGQTVQFREHPEDVSVVDERTRRPLDMPDTTARRIPGMADQQPYGPAPSTLEPLYDAHREEKPPEGVAPIGSEPREEVSGAGEQGTADIVQALQELHTLGEDLKSTVTDVKAAIQDLGHKLEGMNTVGE